jgi:hypothetical protein
MPASLQEMGMTTPKYYNITTRLQKRKTKVVAIVQASNPTGRRRHRLPMVATIYDAVAQFIVATISSSEG